jgi:nucleotide-binding universal stress UspA family protein
VRLTGYLARHDIHAQLDVRTVRRDFAEDLVEYASLHDASYLVMGGYGHSRAGEFLFGGVTRELLRASATPLLIAH